MTKVHRLVVLVVDHDDLGADGVQIELENANFANDCKPSRYINRYSG